MHFRCSGIKHCQFYHPEILEELPQYSRVDAEHINDLRQQAQRIQKNLSASEQIQRSTEAYAKYNLGLYIS